MKLVVRLSLAFLLLFAASGFAACSEDDPVQGSTSSRLVGDGSVDRSDNDRNNMERDIRTTVNGTSFSATFGKM